MANYGKTAIGGSISGGLSNYKWACKFTAPSDIGDVDEILVYANRTTGGGPYSIRGGIYTDNGGAPDALVANSEIVINSNVAQNPAQWYSVAYSIKPTLTPDTVYWLCVQMNFAVNTYYDAGGTSQTALAADTYSDGLADPFGSPSYYDREISIYVTYTAVAGITITPAAISCIAAKVDPTVVLGSMTIAPTPSSAVANKVDPAVSVTTLVTPAPASAVAGKIDPTVALGSVAVTPAPASAVASTVDPTITIVYPSVVVTPDPISMVVITVDPTVELEGSVSLIPDPAAAVAATSGPIVILGSVIITPAPIECVVSTHIRTPFIDEYLKRGTTPINLLEIDFPAPVGTLLIADRDLTVGGDTYTGWVRQWPDRIYSKISGELDTPDIGDCRVVLVNTDTSPFSDYLASADIEQAEARLYQWFAGVPADQKELLFRGVVQGPVEWNEEQFSFDIVSGVSKEKLVGTRILASDYPAAAEAVIGKIKPIVWGEVEKSLGLAVGIGASDQLREDYTSTDTTLKLSDVSRFPDTGNIIIGSDTIAYTGRDATLHNLTGCSGATTDHKKGDLAWEDRDTYDFMFNEGATQEIKDVRINDLLVPHTTYTKDLSTGTISFLENPILQFLSEHEHDVTDQKDSKSTETQYARLIWGNFNQVTVNETQGMIFQPWSGHGNTHLEFHNYDYGTPEIAYYFIYHDGQAAGEIWVAHHDR